MSRVQHKKCFVCSIYVLATLHFRLPCAACNVWCDFVFSAEEHSCASCVWWASKRWSVPFQWRDLSAFLFCSDGKQRAEKRTLSVLLCRNKVRQTHLASQWAQSTFWLDELTVQGKIGRTVHTDSSFSTVNMGWAILIKAHITKRSTQYAFCQRCGVIQVSIAACGGQSVPWCQYTALVEFGWKELVRVRHGCNCSSKVPRFIAVGRRLWNHWFWLSNWASQWTPLNRNHSVLGSGYWKFAFISLRRQKNRYTVFAPDTKRTRETKPCGWGLFQVWDG